MLNPISVFGSINMDLVVYSSSKPSEGETVFGNKFETFLGGKGANQAIAASRLGSAVSFIGKVGNDFFGKTLIKKLEDENIDTDLLQIHDGESGVALINVFENTSQNQIIVVPGANAQARSDQITDSDLDCIEVLISQLEVNYEEIEKLFLRAARRGSYKILNVAPAMELKKSLFDETDLFIVNEVELEALSKEPLKSYDIDTIKSSVESIPFTKNQSIVVTLGSKGVFVSQNRQNEYIKGHKVDALDTTGSGDCFIGALASRLLENDDLFTATHFANKAASLSVTKRGASSSMPTMQEVVNFF